MAFSIALTFIQLQQVIEGSSSELISVDYRATYKHSGPQFLKIVFINTSWLRIPVPRSQEIVD
jgi:hypothetical protein